MRVHQFNSFFLQKNTIPGKKRPSLRVILRSFLTIFVQVSQCQFSLSRGVISVTERQAYIGRVRALAKQCADAFVLTAAGGQTQ